ncbi:hypothetical protein CSPAE12_03759, partial [Colletotrichum incanum]
MPSGQGSSNKAIGRLDDLLLRICRQLFKCIAVAMVRGNAQRSAELPLIFGTHSQYRGNSIEYEWQVADTMQ